MKRFELTEAHVKLLRRASVRWEDCEFGAPAIDCKRPYGNSGVLRDIAEILGEEPAECPHCGEVLGESDTDEARWRRLHKETETALQVVLAAGTFEPGVYVADYYMQNWRPADEAE